MEYVRGKTVYDDVKDGKPYSEQDALDIIIQIAEALEQQGLEVDRKSILLKEAVKEVGEYKATVKLHREVQVEISFEVVAE